MKKKFDSGVIEKQSFFWQWLLPPSVLSFLTVLLYYPTLHYPFQFDDIINITKFYHIRVDNPLTNLGRGRWFSNWLNCLNFKYGHLDPYYYRVANVAIHLIAGIALFCFIYNVCKLLAHKQFFYTNASLIATITTGLFLLHPVQTQTVSYVIQARLEGTAAMFVLISLNFFVYAFRSQNIIAKTIGFLLFGLFSLFACASKEIAVVIPFLAVLFDWFVVSKEQWSVFKKHVFWYLLLVVAFVAIAVKYVGWDTFYRAITLQASVPNNRGNVITSSPLMMITGLSYFMSQFKVIWHYFLIFFWPFSLSVEYDWRVCESFFSLDCIVPFIGLVAVAVFLISNLYNKRFFTITFGSLWFLIAVAPRSSIIPAPELLCDYKAYLASVGPLLMLAVVSVRVINYIYAALQERKYQGVLGRVLNYKQPVALLLTLLFLIPAGAGAYMRNKIWETSIAFWEDTLSKAPNKARAYNNYGVALAEAERIDDAIRAYKKAIDLDKYYQDPLSNIAVAYSMKGDLDGAIGHLNRAIYLSPHYPEAYNNLGSLYCQKGQYEKAIECLNKAIEMRPWYGKAFYNLARVAEHKKQPEKVWENLKKALEGDLDTVEVFEKFGLSSLFLRKYDDAKYAFGKAIERGGSSPETLFNLANAHYMLREHAQAISIYEKLVNKYPSDVRFVYNLAEAHFTTKTYDKALVLFEKAIKMPNALAQAYVRIGNCLEQLNRVDEARDYLQKLAKLPGMHENFLKTVNNEIRRLELQSELKKGKGSIKLSKFNSIIGKQHQTKS